MERIEAIGIERDLAGLPVLYVDPQLLEADAVAHYPFCDRHVQVIEFPVMD